MNSTLKQFHDTLSSNLSLSLYYFCLPFFTLASVIISDFILDSISNSGSVQVLKNDASRSIQYIMNEICVIPFHHIFWEFLWNGYFTLIRYNFDIILTSTKRTFYLFHV